eukprot:356057-Chlamydomonas_euryale.AAC.6
MQQHRAVTETRHCTLRRVTLRMRPSSAAMLVLRMELPGGSPKFSRKLRLHALQPRICINGNVENGHEDKANDPASNVHSCGHRKQVTILKSPVHIARRSQHLAREIQACHREPVCWLEAEEAALLRLHSTTA